MRHPVSWYCFMLVNVFMWAYGVADCAHVIKHPGGMSEFRIVCRWIVLLVCIALMMISFFVLIVGLLGVV